MDLGFAGVGLNIAVGFFIGFAIGLTGIGGGVLVMPSMIHILKIPALPAVGTGLLFAAFTKLVGVIEHLRLKTIRKRTAFYLLCGSVPAVIISSLFLNALARRVNFDRLNYNLQTVIGVVLLLTCAGFIIPEHLISKTKKAGTSGYYRPKEIYPTRFKVIGILSGVIIGILIGATSIGGGILIVPVLFMVFNLSPLDTVGTSIMISVIIAFLGSLAYVFNGNLAVIPALFMVVGAVPGVRLGSRLAAKLPYRVLKLIILLLVIVSAIGMFFRGGE